LPPLVLILSFLAVPTMTSRLLVPVKVRERPGVAEIVAVFPLHLALGGAAGSEAISKAPMSAPSAPAAVELGIVAPSTGRGEPQAVDVAVAMLELEAGQALEPLLGGARRLGRHRRGFYFCVTPGWKCEEAHTAEPGSA
jgi:hypothetical protein